MTDLVLAIFHHILVFGLVVTLAMEKALVRPAMTAADTRKVAGIDTGYGITASLVVVVGVCRVLFGVKGADYYLHNPFFWAKMASFLMVGLLSVPPTIRFIAWRKQLKIEPVFVPPAEEIARVERFLKLEGGFIILILVFAAAMARYSG
jgi:putative membrane protein